MSELDFNYTLFVSEENEAEHPYELQISSVFETAEYVAGEYEILHSPQNETDTLTIQLKLMAGNDATIIHDLNLNILPTYPPKWIIDVEYIDAATGDTLKRKKKNTQQAKIEATPKPYKEKIING